MTRKTDTKAEITNIEAYALIMEQKVARDKKTTRLRDLRLSRDAQTAAAKAATTTNAVNRKRK
ncbi:hypothetical protein GR212_19670 [Rhizobium lusitanum]|uniref:Uncharacterized protein n=2 Tax=Rhizobium lusitanum TaxID=293958 RepID=A0A6L9U8V5_9HYPH|nr:hypothetical protein [Rhizobium lusitanum]